MSKHSVVDAKPSTPAEKLITQNLRQYCDDVAPLEDKERSERRKGVLMELQQMVKAWVARRWVENGGKESEKDRGAKLFISGSYRLGVNDADGDIDTICVCPEHVDADDFFGTDEDVSGSFFQDLLDHPDVSEINCIRGAYVPLIAIENFRRVKIDLLFCPLQRNRIPESLDIYDNDAILINLEEKTMRTLQGPRDTMRITRLLPGDSPSAKTESFEKFKLLLRSTRRWAKKRGLWGNKFGFFGGVNVAILSAFICQLFPNKDVFALLKYFFELFTVWNWGKTPIELCKRKEQDDSQFNFFKQWSPQDPGLMPIITPCYPCMDSMRSATPSSLRIFQQEFKRGVKVIGEVSAQFNEAAKLGTTAKLWEKLFKKPCFLAKFPLFLRVEISARGDMSFQKWKGFAESRIRRLIEKLCYVNHRSKYMLGNIHLWPKAFMVDPEPTPTPEKDDNGEDLDTKVVAAAEDKKPVADTKLAVVKTEEAPAPATKVAEAAAEEKPTGALQSLLDDATVGEADRAEETREPIISCYFLIGFRYKPKLNAYNGKRGMEKEVETFKNDVMSLAEHNGIINEVQDPRVDISYVKYVDLPDSVFDQFGGREYSDVRRSEIRKKEVEAKRVRAIVNNANWNNTVTQAQVTACGIETPDLTERQLQFIADELAEEDPKLRADSYEAVQAKVKLALTAEAQVADPPEPEPEAPDPAAATSIPESSCAPVEAAPAPRPTSAKKPQKRRSKKSPAARKRKKRRSIELKL